MKSSVSLPLTHQQVFASCAVSDSLNIIALHHFARLAAEFHLNTPPLSIDTVPLLDVGLVQDQSGIGQTMLSTGLLLSWI